MNRVILMNCSRKLRNFTREMDEIEEELNNSVKKIDAERDNYTPKYLGEMKNNLNERMKKLIVQTQDKYKNTMNAFRDDVKASINEYVSKRPDRETLLTLMALKGSYVTKSEFDALLPLCAGNYIATKLLKEIVCPSEIYNVDHSTDTNALLEYYANDTKPQSIKQTEKGKMYLEDIPSNVWRIRFKPISAEEINRLVSKVESDADNLLKSYAGKEQGLISLITPKNKFMTGDIALLAVSSSASTSMLDNREIENTVELLANTFGMSELTDTEKSSLDKFYDGIYSDGSKKEKTKELINQEPGFYSLIIKSQYKTFAEPANA